MPVHDWSRVLAGVFHDFHQRWIGAMRDVLNEELLPSGYYALIEQVAEGPIPDVLTLESSPTVDLNPAGQRRPLAGVALAEYPPRVEYVHSTEQDIYAQKASRVAVFHATGDQVVAYIEIVSPGNKHSETAVRRFNNKLAEALERGCHVLVVDVHPPTSRDPRGMHARFWTDAFGDADCPGVTNQKPLGMASYRSDLVPTAYFQPFAVGDRLIDMPVFLTPDHYINVPLETTYADGWRGFPGRWKSVMETVSPE
jgi:hypothetical protein